MVGVRSETEGLSGTAWLGGEKIYKNWLTLHKTAPIFHVLWKHLNLVLGRGLGEHPAPEVRARRAQGERPDGDTAWPLLHNLRQQGPHQHLGSEWGARPGQRPETSLHEHGQHPNPPHQSCVLSRSPNLSIDHTKLLFSTDVTPGIGLLGSFFGGEKWSVHNRGDAKWGSVLLHSVSNA